MSQETSSETRKLTIGQRAREDARLAKIREDPSLTDAERQRYVAKALAEVTSHGRSGQTKASVWIYDLKRDEHKKGNKIPCASDAAIVSALAAESVRATFRPHMSAMFDDCGSDCRCKYGYDLDWSDAGSTPTRAQE